MPSAEKKTTNHKSKHSPLPAKSPRTIEAEAQIEPSNRDRGLTIVGIGASAGGLTALGSFFDALSPKTGMAFVVVTHLHPAHESHMAELLQKHTEMPTRQVTRKLTVEPNQVYVIPPNRSIIMTDTHLEPVEFTEPHGKRSPIDYFFRSMAKEKRESIAIIFSGGGTDGSLGIKDIKEAGGVIMVQHPSDAEYDSMPRAAINTGLVDVVLPAEQLAEKLAEYNQHRPQLPHDAGQLTEQEAEILQRILAQVHARTGHDFNQYKRTTILRRVERRMQLNGFATLEAYLNYLRHNANEAQAIFNDILIGVTNFFRDQASWLALEKQVIPKLFEGKEEGGEIRIWSIGCATGEEAYGLAMLIFEEAERLDIHPHFQVFASDLDEGSIARAREGLYPAAIEADVSQERLERFFLREGDHYRVKHELRDSVLFTNHNVLRDPPFSRQDLIACRNVLIYLQREVQEKVFEIFHYALNLYGYLFLGSSESVEHLPETFHIIDKVHRLYQAKPWQGERPHVPSLPLTLRRNRRPGEFEATSQSRSKRFFTEDSLTYGEQHEKALEVYGPPSVIINENHIILHVSDTAGRYLLQPKGPITGDILKLVRQELQIELRTAIFQAFERDRNIVSGPVFVQFNGHPHRVVLSVRPRTETIGPGRTLERRALILFLENELDESVEAQGPSTGQPSNHAEQNALVMQLQSEVQHLREQLQVTIEEYDSSNEEMKAANEELQSINEEYRSATEELETSKEELQSVNEELQTVNNDMKNKLDEISRAHQELENLMGATDVGTLFLDREMRIQRFTAGVNEIINIMPSDRGRPIGHLTHKLKYHNFTEDAEQVLRQLVPLEREIQTGNDDWYLLRFRPYRTTQDRIEGVVITFINITALKESEEQLMRAKETLEERVLERTRELDDANQSVRQTRDLFYGLFNTNPIPTMLTRLEDSVFLNVNTEFLKYIGLEQKSVIGRSINDIGLELDLDKQNMELLLARVQRDGRVGNYEMEIRHPSGEVRNVLASVQQIFIDSTDALIVAFIDITDRVKAEEQVRALASRLTSAEQQERQRISQILHDDLQQRIFAVKIQLTILYEASQRNDLQSVKIELDELFKLLDESISITRNLSIDLSPAILQGDSLVDALEWLATQMREKYGLIVAVESNGISTKFEDTLRIMLFQAVRELLFNVVKHGNTDHAVVSFGKINGQTCLTIRDDGAGFDVESQLADAKMPGGLMNLKHRLNLIGCQLQISSQSGNGTQVMILIPEG